MEPLSAGSSRFGLLLPSLRRCSCRLLLLLADSMGMVWFSGKVIRIPVRRYSPCMLSRITQAAKSHLRACSALFLMLSPHQKKGLGNRLSFGCLLRINQAWHCYLWHSVLDCVSRDLINKIALPRSSESRCRQAISKYFRSDFHTIPK